MKNAWNRRSFLAALASTTSVLTSAFNAFSGRAASPIAGSEGIFSRSGNTATAKSADASTIQDVIDLILGAIPDAPLETTVDTVKSGDASQEVTGIATTFLATCEVIERAAEADANLIITHEPTFYNHFDDVDWLEEDAVYAYKRRLLDEHGMVVWRFHDYWHLYEPDGILTGLLKKLEWEDRVVSEADRVDLPSTVEVPAVPVAELAEQMKARLQIDHPIQIVGNTETVCRRVGLLPGAYGGRSQIEFVGRSDIDVLVVGEINEWETSVYVRDAVSSGRPMALIILGHVNSEEPGMEWLADWLQPLIGEIPIVHIPARDPFILV